MRFLPCGQEAPMSIADDSSARTIAIARVIGPVVVTARAGVEQVAPEEAAFARQRPNALLMGHEIAVGAAAATAAVFGAPRIGVVGLGLGGPGRCGHDDQQRCDSDAHLVLLLS